MDFARESLKMREKWGGKIGVVCTVPCQTRHDLPLACAPGVAGI